MRSGTSAAWWGPARGAQTALPGGLGGRRRPWACPTEQRSRNQYGDAGTRAWRWRRLRQASRRVSTRHARVRAPRKSSRLAKILRTSSTAGRQKERRRLKFTRRLASALRPLPETRVWPRNGELRTAFGAGELT